MKKTNFLIVTALLLLLWGCAFFLLSCDEQSDPCAAGHTELTDAAVAATCTAKGLSEGKHCAVCDKVLLARVPTDTVAHTAGEWITALAATCNQAGSQYRKCTVCDSILETQTLTAGAHQYSEWKTESAATCTKEGSRSRTCTLCGEQQSESIAAFGHENGSWNADPARPASCTQEGVKWMRCTRCDTVVSIQQTAALGHSFGEWSTVTPASCTALGRKTRACVRCQNTESEILPLTAHSFGTPEVLVNRDCGNDGMQLESCTACGTRQLTVLPALTHMHGDWSVITPADCATSGLKERTCTNAGCAYKESEILPALEEHAELTWVTAQEPTCNKGGIQHQKCLTCDTILEIAITDPLQHAFGEWETQAKATCAQAGLKARCCSNADCEAKELESIPVAEHAALTWITDTQPTCSRLGTKHQECEDCGAVTALESIEKAEHSFTIWQVQAEASCTSEGTKVRHCTAADCALEQSEVIPLKSHTFLDWVTDIAPSCTNKGVKHRDCSTCQQTAEVVTLPQLPHPYPAYTVTLQPTCDTAGEQTRTCPDCGTTQRTVIPVTGHTLGDWQIVADATETANGSKIRDCTTCLRTVAVEIIPATGIPFLYTVDNGSVTLTGYTDFASAALVIPDTLGDYPVTRIASNAFRNATRFTSITLPNSLEKIEAGAFDGCTAITLENGLAILDGWLLWADPSLYELTLPTTIKKIADGAFAQSRKLVHITNQTGLSLTALLPSNPGLEIRTSAQAPFTNVLSFSSDFVTYKVGSVNYLLAYTGSLRVLNLSVQSISAIYAYALAGHPTVRELTIPDTITRIGENAFSGCQIETLSATIDAIAHVPTTHLKSLTVTGTPLEIPSNFLNGCSTLETLVFPSTVKVARKQALGGCINVKSLTGPAEMLTAEVGKSLSKLTTLYVNGGTAIPKNAFAQHPTLCEVHVATSVKTIGEKGFFGCHELKTFVFDNINSSNLTTLGNYQFGGNKKMTSFTIPPKVTKIPAQCFSGCTALTAISIPNGVTSIMYEAFQGCTSLTAVTIPASVARLENLAGYSDVRGVFENCTSLKKVTFESGSKLTLISNYCFYNCKALTSLSIPASVTSIGKGAFEGSGVTSITFGNTANWKVYRVTSLGDQTATAGFKNLGTGSGIAVSNVSNNATYFKSTYKNYIWKRD